MADHERRPLALADVGHGRLHALGLLLERLAAREAEVRVAVEPRLEAVGILGLDLGHGPAGPVAAVRLDQARVQARLQPDPLADGARGLQRALERTGVEGDEPIGNGALGEVVRLLAAGGVERDGQVALKARLGVVGGLPGAGQEDARLAHAAFPWMIAVISASVGQAMPWRSPARSTAPAMASSSGARRASRSRCIDERKSSWTSAISRRVASASAGAPSARATATVSRTTPSRAALQRGAARTAPSGRPAALVTVASATRRVSLLHSTSVSSSTTSVGMPAARRSAATGSRRSGSPANSTRRNGLVCSISPGAVRADSTRIEAATARSPKRWRSSVRWSMPLKRGTT